MWSSPALLYALGSRSIEFSFSRREKESGGGPLMALKACWLGCLDFKRVGGWGGQLEHRSNFVTKSSEDLTMDNGGFQELGGWGLLVLSITIDCVTFEQVHEGGIIGGFMECVCKEHGDLGN
ncbi:hypothetical protein Tco_0783029 [Tanacetum coccineum]